MRKTWTIVRHEFLRTLRTRTYIIMTLALPVLVILGYGIYQGVQSRQPAEPSEVEIGYVDLAGGFDQYTTQDGAVLVEYATADEAEEAMLSGVVKEYFIISSDYLSTGLITRYTMEREIGISDEAWSRMHRFLVSNLLEGEVSAEVAERANQPMLLNSLRLNEDGQVIPAESELQAYLVPIVFAFVFYFALIFSAQALFQSVTEEKENRVIEIILSSVSSRQLLAGKVLGLGVAGLIQVAVWFTTIYVFAGVASVNIPALSELSITPGMLGWAVVYFVPGYLLFAALFAGIGAIGNARDAQAMSGIFIMPAVLPLMLNFFITSNPEGALARALTIFPLTAPITAMMRLPNDAMAAWEIAVSLLVLVGSVVATTWLAAKVFRTFLLMYGRPPALREMVRYIREA